MKILALDLRKYNTVFCDCDADSGAHEFGKVKTTPQAIHDLLMDRERVNPVSFSINSEKRYAKSS
jgi:hypothetical protein